jgi:hypothetical protein
LRHLKSLWRDEEADRMGGVGRLVYRSDNLGSDLTPKPRYLASPERGPKTAVENEVIYVPWQRPGFDSGLRIEPLIQDNPRAKGGCGPATRRRRCSSSSRRGSARRPGTSSPVDGGLQDGFLR